MISPPPYSYQFDYWVAYADTDQMGVVYYANFLVIFERARSAMLRDAGYPYSQMEADGYLLPVLEAHVDYKFPAHFDDKLIVSVEPNFLGQLRTRINCRVHRDDVMLAEGYTIHACYSSEKNRPVRFPSELKKAVDTYHGTKPIGS